MRIHSLRLLTADVDALADFYGGALGLPLLEHTPGRMAVQAGRTRLNFAAGPAGWRGAYHFAFNIPENQLAAAKAWWAARAPLIRSAAGEDEFDFANWQAHAVYGYDPAGNIVELIARHALDNAASGEFDGQGLLGVSEIGLASADVAVTVRELAETLGVGIFRGSASETFAAVGDDEGLFIVVRAGRTWYPDTGVRADALPVDVTVAVTALRGGEERHYTVSGPPYRIAPAAGD